jgi:class 3 adenylate cyclase
VARPRGDDEAPAGRPEHARRHREAADGWLDAAVRRAAEGNWALLEAYALKDHAAAALALGRPADAEDRCGRAERLFQGAGFAEGLAHVRRALGTTRRHQGRWAEAQGLLRAALRHFQDSGESSEVARTQLELARTQRAAGEPPPLASLAFQDALRAAEACRRPHLVRQVEAEFQAVDVLAHGRWLYQRVRGRGVAEETASLVDGVRETATVLYLDLQGSTDYALGRDPEEVMMTLNQMMADFVAVLRRHEARVSGFRGDGFLALFRGADHATRAVTAGLDLYGELSAFNEPREVLGLPPFAARVGIASGEVFLGNVGTYDKMDFTAIGTTANLGARLEGQAAPGRPCISRQTYELVRDRFRYAPGSPRALSLKGLGEHLVWDVVGRA